MNNNNKQNNENDPRTSEESNTNSILHPKLTIPNYFNDENGTPQKWLDFVKLTLTLSGIKSSRTLCSHTLSALPSNVLNEISDQISSLEKDTDPFEKLYNILLNKNKINRRQMLEACLNNTQLGNNKPSDFLRQLKQNLEYLQPNITNSGSNELLKEFFMRAMPPEIRRILAASNSDTVETLAEIADKINEEILPSICSTKKHNFQNNSGEEKTKNDNTEILIKTLMTKLDDLFTENRKIREEINEIRNSRSRELNYNNHRNYHNRSHSRSFSHNRSNSRNKYPQHTQKNFGNKDTNLCYFHNKFGDKAYKCTKPCTYHKN